MNSESSRSLPWLSLGLFWCAYAMLGWYLAAHHIIWLVGAAAILAIVIISGTGRALLEQLFGVISRTLLIVVFLSFLISVCAFLFVSKFEFLGLVFLPLVTTVLADLSLRSAGFEQRQMWIYLVVIAGLGIGLGEVFDLVFLPSMRY